MAEQESWDNKRQEVWQRIVNAEEELKNLKEKLSAVEILANNKISENEQTAIDSAKNAFEGAEKVTQLVNQASELSGKLTTFQINFEKAIKNIDIINSQKDTVTTSVTYIADARASSEISVKEIVVLQENAKKSAEDAEAKWATTNQQVQNIATLNAQASSDAAIAKTAREEVESGQSKISQIKKDLNDFQDEKTQELSSLNQKYLHEFETRKIEIESLLPGATAAGLAKAFHDRKIDVEKNKKWWVLLLIISVIGLISLGVLSLSPWGTQLGITSSFTARTLIVAGFILLEEFARRNFNIVSRLSELYAYKEALAKSYIGYKQQMESIPMPSNEENGVVMGHSVLMKAFLDKLEDEPSKHVFDKEKHVIGIGALMDKLSPNNPDGSAGKAVEELSKGNILMKISWPIVAVVGILAAAGCIIVYLVKEHLA